MGNYDRLVYIYLKYAILIGIVLSFVSLIICSILVFDTYYIQIHPKQFLSETILMGVLTSIPIAFLCYIRGTTSYKKILAESLIFFAKIVFIHIGFQLSGIYSVIFPESAPPYSGL